jgi:SAM-dependent methyltransferase
MYQKIKQIVLKLAPKKLLFKYEYPIRFLYSRFFLGQKHQCNICKTHLRDFISTPQHLICPRCGSIARNRRLWQLLNDGLLQENSKVLDFSPSRNLYRVMKTMDINYESTDLSGDFLAEKSYDITQMACPDENYDLIICYHILEHIDDDQTAMQELFRVLKKGGTCLVQTPFKAGETFEDSSIKSKEEREKHFGQIDHVRIYAKAGLKARLEKAGFVVTQQDFSSETENLHGFSPSETVMICSKPKS